MELLCPKDFSDYELIDAGNFLKLERFGQYITIRPEPQAVWAPVLTEKEWERRAHVRFVPKSSSSGSWQKLKAMPDQWQIRYQMGNDPNRQLVFRLGLTSFKHVGVFPEQAANWDFIYSRLRERQKPKFLNLFAYTGGASLAARAAGAEVTHVDSVKQVVTWANENMKLSGLDNIRWMVDDALKFVKKEIRRGNHYDGIILDPPAYGHGPTGEKWKLEENIHEMIGEVTSLLSLQDPLFILNTYSLGFSFMILENLLSQSLPKNIKPAYGELYLQATTGVKLPLGVFARFAGSSSGKGKAQHQR